MMVFFENQVAKLKLTSALLAVASISACASTTTAPTLVAGAPSTHTPQTYQTNTSTANVTSTTAGVALLIPVDATGNPAGPAVLARSTGTVNHQTGAIALNDGVYPFVDADGPTLLGAIADGAGASGSTSPLTYGGATYAYVNGYDLSYTVIGGQKYRVFGFAGVVTGAADMPDGGSATYTGIGSANFQTANLSGVSSSAETQLSGGNSTVAVNFASGTATVDLNNFTTIQDGNGLAYLPGTNPIDAVRGTGLVVSGSRLSGGTWQMLKGGGAVTPLGTSPVATSEGTFFGYDPSISAPDEVAGLVLITGASQAGLGVYAAD